MFPIPSRFKRFSIPAAIFVSLGSFAGPLLSDGLTLSDNLTSPTAYTETVQGQTWVGAPFRTDASPASLSSIDLLLGIPQTGDALLSVYTGDFHPETLVSHLLSVKLATTPDLSLASFDGSGLLLAADTGYWVVLSSVDGRFEWAYTESETGTGPGFTPGWGVTNDASMNWFTQMSEPMQMRVEVNTLPDAPEPSSLTALGISILIVGLVIKRRPEWAALSTGIVLLLHLPVTSTAATSSVVSIVSPKPGDALSGGSVPVTVMVNPAAAGAPLEVWLNGKSVGSLFTRSGHCRPNGCPYMGTLTKLDGLRSGNNLLRVRLGTAIAPRGAWQTSFELIDSSVGDDPSTYLSVAQGLTTVGPGGGGANGWVKIYDNQGSGSATIYPISGACTEVYQVLALSRVNLSFKSYTCYNSDAAFTQALQSFGPGDLVIAGTSYGHISLTKLDTRPVGGSNYGDPSFPSNNFPRGYMIVGVGQAPTGQAYENASTWGTGDSSDNWARANGLLALDSSLNYNFHPSDYVEFKVRPTDSRDINSGSSITVGLDTYTTPENDYALGGFWLLVLDRRNLSSHPGCTASSNDPHLWPNCGTFYASRTPGSDEDKQIWANLATALGNIGQSDLVFLVATSGLGLSPGFLPANLGEAIDSLGGSGYTLGRFAIDSNFTLISSHDAGFATALTGSSVVSTSAGEGGSYLGQTGFVKGVLGRDRNGLFRPLGTSQETAQSIDSVNATDFSSYGILWAQPVPWPLMDTPGHVAAYQWLSYKVVEAVLGVSASGPYLDNLRYYYTGDFNQSLSQGGLNSLVNLSFPNSNNQPYTWCGPETQPYKQCVSFTVADLLGDGSKDIAGHPTDGVAGQIASELAYLETSIDYLGTALGGQGIGGTLGGSGNSLTSAMLTAMSTVQNSEYNGLKDLDAKASANPSQWLALAGSVLSIPGAVAPPLGILSGVLNVAAGISAIADSNMPSYSASTIPGAFASYETTLSNLSNRNTQYLTDVQNALDTARDNVYSDWGRLQTVGQKTGDAADGNPWYVSKQVGLTGKLEPLAALGASRYAYLQLVPQRYQLDYWPADTANLPSQIGTWLYDPHRGNDEFCDQFYSDNPLPLWSWVTYTNPSDSTKTDNFVIGGSISNNYSAKVSEQYPSSDLVQTLFDPTPSSDPTQIRLILPRDLFFSVNGPLQRRNGPQYSNGGKYGGRCYVNQ